MFTDARILLFPVSSMAGPRWVTSPFTLLDAGILTEAAAADWSRLLVPDPNDYRFYSADSNVGDPLNLGWLYLKKAAANPRLVKPALVLPPELKAAPAAERWIMVHDDVFTWLVNDNLEVRTSVSINPATGTAKGGALFTAEAIPRATLFWFEYSVLDKKNFRVPGQGPVTADALFDRVGKALAYMETLGVGGLNTRGMGRLRVAPAAW
jgi:CRISPR-associated protein Cmr4